MVWIPAVDSRLEYQSIDLFCRLLFDPSVAFRSSIIPVCWGTKLGHICPGIPNKIMIELSNMLTLSALDP
jgi:hypothetical protein